MVNAYSNDLRKKVIEFLESGETQVEACRVFNISKSAVFCWWHRWRNTGRIDFDPPVIKPRKIDHDKLLNAVKNNPDRTLKEYAMEFNVSIKGVWSVLKKAGITLKKQQRIKKATNINVKNSKKSYHNIQKIG